MTKVLCSRLTAFAALTMLSLAVAPAIAQTAPNPGSDVSREGVREILNRAETERTRRTLGDILGNAAGVSRAQAQTAPAQAPASASNNGAGDTTAARAGNSRTPAAPAVAQSLPASQQSVAQGPAPAAQQQQQGTAVDPTMIVRVSDPNAAPAVSTAAETAAAQPAVSAASPSTLTKATTQPTVIALRRTSVEWCPPTRW